MSHSTLPNLNDWIFIKDRGALFRDGGAVYRSQDGAHFLRTGKPEVLLKEVEFLRDAHQRGFRVPRIVDSGWLPNGQAYFIETSAGEEHFAGRLAAEHSASGSVSDELFEEFCEIVLHYLSAQIHPDNHQEGSRRLHEGIQIPNILKENPDIPASLLDQALAKAERRTAQLPLVLTHGDFNPFNIMTRGVIDFELRFTAPAGYDIVTCISFQRIWDHPQPDGTGTMKMWDFTSNQISTYLERIDQVCAAHGVPAISPFFDDFLMLKALWAVSYEHPEGRPPSQVQRWQWRRRVALYCIDQYLSDQPIDSESFYHIGLGKPRDLGLS